MVGGTAVLLVLLVVFAVGMAFAVVALWRRSEQNRRALARLRNRAASDNASVLGRLDAAEQAISDLKTQSAAQGVSIATLQSDVKTTQGDVKDLQGDVKSQGASISTLQGATATNTAQIGALNARLTTDEATIATQGAAIATQGAAIAGLQTNFVTLGALVNQNEADDIARDQAQQAQIDALKTDVTQLQTDVTKLQADVAALEAWKNAQPPQATRSVGGVPVYARSGPTLTQITTCVVTVTVAGHATVIQTTPFNGVMPYAGDLYINMAPFQDGFNPNVPANGVVQANCFISTTLAPLAEQGEMIYGSQSPVSAAELVFKGDGAGTGNFQSGETVFVGAYGSPVIAY